MSSRIVLIILLQSNGQSSDSKRAWQQQIQNYLKFRSRLPKIDFQEDQTATQPARCWLFRALQKPAPVVWQVGSTVIIYCTHWPRKAVLQVSLSPMCYIITKQASEFEGESKSDIKANAQVSRMYQIWDPRLVFGFYPKINSITCIKEPHLSFTQIMKETSSKLDMHASENTYAASTLDNVLRRDCPDFLKILE